MINRKEGQSIKQVYTIVISISLFWILGGCVPTERAKNSAVVQTKDFAVVQVQEGDTFESLATDYYHDPSLAWRIAEFNEMKESVAGSHIIIPFVPFKRGGLHPDGYQTVPIFAYHNFSIKKTNKMTVRKTAFEEQMQYLADNDYQVISLQQLTDFLNFAGDLPERSVVITIDDGWRSMYEIAYPVLKHHGFPATLFVNTDLINKEQCLSWEQIGEMATSGIDIQNHSLTHRNLGQMQEKESPADYLATLDKEIAGAETLIVENLNIQPNWFSYPYSETNSLLIGVLKKYGYQGALTVNRGSNPFFIDTYRLNRTMIFGEYTLAKFKENLKVYKAYRH